MTKIYVNYKEEFVSGGEICAGQENEAWPSYEDSIYDFRVESITRKNVSPTTRSSTLTSKDLFPWAFSW